MYNILIPFQLFRRVAAALPGMEQTETKRGESILCNASSIYLLFYSLSGHDRYIHLVSFIFSHFFWLKLEICLIMEGKVSNRSNTDK